MRWVVSTAIDRLSSIKWGVRYRLMILGVVTYVLVVARTGTPTVPTALGVPYDYAPAVTRVLGPTIAMSVMPTIVPEHIKHVQQQQKLYADKRRMTVSELIVPGAKAYLDIPKQQMIQFGLRPSKKLSPMRREPR